MRQKKQQGNDPNASRSTCVDCRGAPDHHFLIGDAVAEEGQIMSTTMEAGDPAPLTTGEARSYQALKRWLEQYSTAKPTFQSGQRLTIKDQEAIKPFLPAPLWEYYFYPDMDMKIAPTGVYPTPKEWGAKVDTDFELKRTAHSLGLRVAVFRSLLSTRMIHRRE